MSRNVRQKQAPSSVQATRKRRGSDSSSSLNLSDDDGYSGVEDVSDSDDDDDEHVFAAEEEHIISNESPRRRPVAPPPRPEQDSDEDADEDDGDDEDDDEDEDDDDDEDEPEDDDAGDDNASWNGIQSDRDDTAAVELACNYIIGQDVTSVQRHVRFTGVPDSDSDSTTSETSDNDVEDFFPDIFVAQNSLDPSFRREIEEDEDSSNSGSFWDLNTSSQNMFEPESDDAAQESDDDTPTATPMMSQTPTAASTPAPEELQELDGYETDGDTTEEEEADPAQQPIRRKQIRRIEPVSSDSDTERPVRFRRGKPRLGRFNLDSTDQKPIAVVNPISRKMMIFTPQKMSRLELSPDTFNVDFTAQELASCSPLMSNPGYVMMGAMLTSNTFSDFMNTQPFGPAEAFFPMTSDGITGDDTDYSEADIPDEEDQEESMLKLEDFVAFDSESSDDEVEAEGEWNGDLESSPTRPKTAASGTSAATDSSMDLHPLLSHFDNNSNAVGAFRRNQINQQLIFSDKATQESLAFSGPYYHGCLRGIKSGSLETVTAPITPARRHKRANTMVGLNGYTDQSAPSSPIGKRKASENLTTDSLHKRHRSISEMESMAIH
ncbi:hypothetical protein B0T19DRAFT_239181 [Cercophora scortea]|uniref:Uncharacterized protein n=1 Tax=Cercophora scortea TaxID=314031 RepID=A0AAE0M9Y0_9PEZI|nr:hypothetical protein B0T19DRAFT_239181 [Cercophora scortea]